MNESYGISNSLCLILGRGVLPFQDTKNGGKGPRLARFVH